MEEESQVENDKDEEHNNEEGEEKMGVSHQMMREEERADEVDHYVVRELYQVGKEDEKWMCSGGEGTKGMMWKKRK